VFCSSARKGTGSLRLSVCMYVLLVLMSKEVWNEYYSKKSAVSRFIEYVNERYFSRVFEGNLVRIVGGVRGVHLLEAACGSGVLSARLAKRGAEVTLLDISRNALKIASENLDVHCARGTILKADILKMPMNEGSFDVVWNQGVIEHFDVPEDVVSEMLRVTKKDGYLVIFVPAFLSPLHFVYMFLTAVGRIDLWPFDRQIFYRSGYLKKVMEKAGCRGVKVRRIWASFGFSLVGYAKR